MFSKEIHDQFIEHAQSKFPQEAVGVVIHHHGADEYVPLTNIHETPEKAFEVAGEEYAAAHERGTIKALLHSHTPFEATDRHGDTFMDITKSPSKTDMELQLQLEIPMGIGLCMSAESCGVPYYFGDQLDVIPPLLGREYLYNVRDCYTLVRDYFRTREKNPVTLPLFPADEHWWEEKEDNPNVFLNNFKAAGFQEIPLADVRPGDCFLMMIQSKVINHCGIMVEPQVIMHHLHNHLSHRETASRWYPFIVKWVRHEKDFEDA